MRRIPAPIDTQKAWDAFKNQRNMTPNLSLIFDHFVEFNPQEKTGQHLSFERSMDSTVKSDNFYRLVSSAQAADGTLLRAWNERWQATVKTAQAEPFDAATDWRFIPGFGRKGSLDIGFSFHRYGFPYLAGSAVKGIARTSAVILLAEELKITRGHTLQELDDALCIEVDSGKNGPAAVLSELGLDALAFGDAQQELIHQFRVIFGSQDFAGHAIFFPAIPKGGPKSLPKLERDLLNPHFSQYYRGGAEAYPVDSDNPIPVSFLAVAPGQTFRFAVGWRGALNQPLRELAAQWLQFGLQELGAGAKTTSGYGYFQIPRETTTLLSQNSDPQPTAPPQAPIVKEKRFGTVAKKQISPGNIAVLDEQNQKVEYIPMKLFKGKTPAGKTRVYYELQDEKIVSAGIV